jgi:RNA polymerase sigma-70 factor (ECF subfamily)
LLYFDSQSARLAGINAPPDPHVTATPSLHAQLEAMRPMLVRFAQLQLRNEALAEDAVQDALIAVLEKPERFAGQSTLRTYVTGILKYKIIDNLRAATRERQIEANEDQSEDEVVDALFLQDGHTRDMPRQWGDPDATLEQKDFFRVLEVCLEKLPVNTARVFMMREWLELETDEICKELAISSSNAWVLLYRARLRLRECLDLNWFGNTAPEAMPR